MKIDFWKRKLGKEKPKRKKGLEPSTLALARLYSTIKLFPLASTKQDNKKKVRSPLYLLDVFS
jgi:hypothetical protein